jgi:hypothetical protein
MPLYYKVRKNELEVIEYNDLNEIPNILDDLIVEIYCESKNTLESLRRFNYLKKLLVPTWDDEPNEINIDDVKNSSEFQIYQNVYNEKINANVTDEDDIELEDDDEDNNIEIPDNSLEELQKNIIDNFHKNMMEYIASENNKILDTSEVVNTPDINDTNDTIDLPQETELKYNTNFLRNRHGKNMKNCKKCKKCNKSKNSKCNKCKKSESKSESESESKSESKSEYESSSESSSESNIELLSNSSESEAESESNSIDDVYYLPNIKPSISYNDMIVLAAGILLTYFMVTIFD